MTPPLCALLCHVYVEGSTRSVGHSTGVYLSGRLPPLTVNAGALLTKGADPIMNSRRLRLGPPDCSGFQGTGAEAFAQLSLKFAGVAPIKRQAIQLPMASQRAQT